MTAPFLLSPGLGSHGRLSIVTHPARPHRQGRYFPRACADSGPVQVPASYVRAGVGDLRPRPGRFPAIATRRRAHIGGEDARAERIGSPEACLRRFTFLTRHWLVLTIGAAGGPEPR